MVVQDKLYTVQNLLELSKEESSSGKFYELVNGELIEMSPASSLSSRIGLKLAATILAYVEQYDLGYVTGADGGYVLSTDPDTVRAPDVGFVAKDRVEEYPSEGYLEIAPDLAVEVVSTSDSANEVQAKALEYIKYGVKLVWVVFPKSKTLMVYTSDGVELLKEDQTLPGGDVLPDFVLPVKDIFPSDTSSN